MRKNINCFADPEGFSTPIEPIEKSYFDEWFLKQSPQRQEWVKTVGFKADPGTVCILSGHQGEIDRIVIGYAPNASFQSWGSLRTRIPAGTYAIDAPHFSHEQLERAYLVWGLDAYKFDRYKTGPKQEEVFKLAWSDSVDKDKILREIQAIYWVRDLVNTPANDLNPETLAVEAEKLSKHFKASVSTIVGEDLLEENFPMIYAVGKASAIAPRLIDIQWGSEKHPKVTLVGKGVTFDSGGLNLKPDGGMKLMKKDMGGAAHVLGLASMIMDAKLPIRLRVLIPAVENAVSGIAFRPLDIIKTRLGKTVEVGNTDAEGRLVLCDALALAEEEDPDLVIDCATLTGAARVALGPDMPALFSNDDELARQLVQIGVEQEDHVWQMPLYTPYASYLKSEAADMNNISKNPQGGAITAALFLYQFIKPKTKWVHLDMMAWNLFAKPGRPEGGEAQSIRTLFSYLKKTYS